MLRTFDLLLILPILLLPISVKYHKLVSTRCISGLIGLNTTVLGVRCITDSLIIVLLITVMFILTMVTIRKINLQLNCFIVLSIDENTQTITLFDGSKNRLIALNDSSNYKTGEIIKIKKILL